MTFAKFLLEYSSVNFASKKMRAYGLLLILEKKILVHSKRVQNYYSRIYCIHVYDFFLYIYHLKLSTLFELKYYNITKVTLVCSFEKKSLFHGRLL